MATVVRPNEISFNGTYFPTLGPVKVDGGAQLAEKRVFGDYSKDSDKFVSSMVWSDHRGGLGVYDMKEGVDDDRSIWSTAEIDVPGHLTLPGLVTIATNPTAAVCSVLVEYSNALYAAFTTDVRLWDEAGAAFGDSLRTLLGTPTDAIEHKGKLYFACGTDFERLTGPATWTTGAALAVGGAKPGILFIEWDGKLFMLDNTGLLKYTTDEGVNWTNNAQSVLPAGSFKDLFLYHNSGGDLIIYMRTTKGIYQLDYTNAEWLDAGLGYPENAYGGAAVWHQGNAAYVAAGMTIWQYSMGSGGAKISLVGLNKPGEYGLLDTYAGNVQKLLATHNNLFALVRGQAASYAALYRWNGKGWTAAWLSSELANADMTGIVATPDGNYRLWFAEGTAVYYLPLPTTVSNPLEAGLSYRTTANHQFPWFDANNVSPNKLALKVTAYVSGATAGRYVKLYIYYDYSGSGTTLSNTTFTDGQIDANGETEFVLASGAGVAFKSVKLEADLVRGATATSTPDLQWLRLDYMPLPDERVFYTVDVDCARPYRHKRAGTIVEVLKSALAPGTLKDFFYRSIDGTVETRQVKLTSMKGPESGAKLKDGQYRLTFLQVNS